MSIPMPGGFHRPVEIPTRPASLPADAAPACNSQGQVLASWPHLRQVPLRGRTASPHTYLDQKLLPPQEGVAAADSVAG